jgi:UDP-N-acetyl-D-mannosaminuronic acid transferase (WecB/TagA/CpsF family)
LPEIIDQINMCQPDILLIGISYPIKERFAVKYKHALNTKLIVPCGGAFDVFAGKTKKYKEVSRYIPTSWLVRFIQEPARLFKPIILTMLYSLLWVYPALWLKHIFVSRNPDVGKHFGLSGTEWDLKKGTVKP